jgi:hypothetical protein
MPKTQPRLASYSRLHGEPCGKPSPDGNPLFKFMDEVLLDNTELDWVTGIEWSKGSRMNGWQGSWVYRLANHHSAYGYQRLTKV